MKWQILLNCIYSKSQTYYTISDPLGCTEQTKYFISSVLATYQVHLLRTLPKKGQNYISYHPHPLRTDNHNKHSESVCIYLVRNSYMHKWLLELSLRHSPVHYAQWTGRGDWLHFIKYVCPYCDVACNLWCRYHATKRLYRYFNIVRKAMFMLPWTNSCLPRNVGALIKGMYDCLLLL